MEAERRVAMPKCEFRHSRVRSVVNDGRDSFSPGGQPHFKLDFVWMLGSAFQWHYPTPKAGNHITIMADLVRPVCESGEVKLERADPLEQPNINLSFFADDLDIIAMREGVRFTYDVSAGPAAH